MASKSQKLAENLAYYVGSDKRCRDVGTCYYSGTSIGKDTDGCFVGRFLTPEDRIKADKCGGDVGGLLKRYQGYGIKLPKIVTENEDLMGDFQVLHDANRNWDGFLLSDEGKRFLESIIKTHKLVKKHFVQFL